MRHIISILIEMKQALSHALRACFQRVAITLNHSPLRPLKTPVYPA